LFFFFYFNRLFATLLSYGIRAYTWHYYRAYVDIHALQISLLGGRIFFKGIRYHGVNETILIQGGYVTWNYWKRTVKQTDFSRAKSLGYRQGSSHNNSDKRSGGDNGSSQSASQGEKGGLKETDRLPCRIVVTLYGLEWFIYNRTPAYDSILAGFGYTKERGSFTDDDGNLPPSSSSARSTSYQSVGHDAGKAGVSFNRFSTSGSSGTSPSNENPSAPRNSFGQSQNDTDMSSGQGGPTVGRETEASMSKILQLLPVKLECTKGAIVIGNENTRTVLTTTFEKANGTIDASDAGPLDLYRQIFSFEFDHPVVQLRPNPDFKQSQLAAAKSLSSLREDENGSRRKRNFHFNYQLRKRKIWYSIRDLIPYFQKSVESFHVDAHAEKATGTTPAARPCFNTEGRWHGLSRYLDDYNEDEHEGWNAIEYARFSTLMDFPGLSLCYYWDIPGKVSVEQPEPSSLGRKMSQDINGANPPEWGLDLKIEGGTINYGPWADRERVGLQNVFFPNPYRSSHPAEPLAPGEARQSTVFRIRVEINQETTLRIPTREESKDWQWKGRVDAIRDASRLKRQKEKRRTRNKEGEKGNVGPDIRPFGWLSLRVARDSTITYTMDMVASSSGYRNRLTLDLRDSRMSSSVNHGLLWQCPRQTISCDLSNPLGWNSLRTWNFKIESHEMELFLLRDHIFLLTDLIGDWTSGPPSDYYTFVPFIYNISLNFTDLRLFLNVNDSNIISNPSDLDDNTFLVIKGKRLTSDVGIPITKYKPEQNTVKFNANLHDGGIDVLTPLWNTLHTFLNDRSTATLKGLVIDGSYSYYTSTSPSLTDTLVLNIAGVSPKLYLYGFLIRYFMKIRDNYFGEEMHFKTLEEFQESANSEQHSAEHNGINPNKKSNDLDVMIHVTVDNTCALLPTKVYDHVNSLRLSAASIEADMRFTNYYMDLDLSLSPLTVALESLQSEGSTTISNPQLFVDGVWIYGHRLFGLPPTEPTYVCNWDFGVGKIVGECSIDFLRCMITALRNFDFSLDDKENALPPLHPVALHDVTFLRLRLDSIHIAILVDQTALVLSSGATTMHFNDWANSTFSKRLNLAVPDITIAAFDRKSDARLHGITQGRVATHAVFQTSVELKMVHRKWNFYEDRTLQQQHIRVHDQRTHRTPWLLFDPEPGDQSSLLPRGARLNPPAMPVPFMPEPVVNTAGLMDTSSSRSASEFRKNLSHKSSFLSSDSSILSTARDTWKESIRNSSKRVPEVQSSRDSVSWNEDPGQTNRGHRPRQAAESRPPRYSDSAYEDASSPVAGPPNPWSMPYFPLHKVVPDTTQLPSLPPIPPSRRKSFAPDGNVASVSSHFEDDETTHVNVFCELSSGVKGFCAPEFLYALSSLIQGLQPTHPEDIIDSLQTGVISDIVAQEEIMDKPKKTTNISVRIPSTRLRLINSSRSPAFSDQCQFQDEYNIAISHLSTTFRTKVERRKGDLIDGIQQSLIVHAAADTLDISAEGRRADAVQGKAELKCSLKETNFWLVTAPSVQSRLQIRAFDTVTSTKSVEHLAFLVRRTTTMLDSVTSSFKYSSSSDTKRLRFLIYFLTQFAADIPDPLFLTRPSYVLRVARSHLRRHDSWKIISRLRIIYRNLPQDRQRELETKCTSNEFILPQNAKSMVLSSFDQWRSWDLAHVEKSYVMKKVWGNLGSACEDTVLASSAFSLAIKTSRFCIDPGPKESGFVVEGLSSAIVVNPRTDAGRPSKAFTLRSYCSSAALQLRWEILDLVEGVTRAMSNVTLEFTTPSGAPGDAPNEPTELHIVLGADTGSVTLDGINLRLALIGQGLKGSLVRQSHCVNVPDQVSLLLSAEACSAEFSNRSKILMLWRIWDPNLYCSHMSEESETHLEHNWKLAGSCRKLRYDMKEDPLGLIHTADRVIEDEVRYIRELVKNLDLSAGKSSPISPTGRSDRHQFHVVLFLDDYRVSISLLPSLAYTISGEVARMSVMPRKDSRLEVDFDVKTNTHVFQSNEGQKWQTVSALEIPPINGRLLARLLPNHTAVDADITIELIRLEASAVRSLLSAVNGSAISHLLSDIQESVQALRLHLDDVLALEKPATRSAEPVSIHDVFYNVRLTMAGMGIHASAPGLKSNEYSADMDFSFGMIQMRLDNGSEQGRPLELPKFHVNISQIILDLRRRERSGSRSYGSLAVDAGLLGTSRIDEKGERVRAYHLTSKGFDVQLYAETASLVVDIAAHLQERIKTLDLSHEVKRFKRLRYLARSEIKPKTLQVPDIEVTEVGSQNLFNSMFSVELANIQVSWIMTNAPSTVPRREPQDLVFSIKWVNLSTKKRNAAKLRIEDMQLQMAPRSEDKRKRTLNSALMPELVFNVAYLSTKEDLRLVFQAAGKSLDIRATTEFILPASLLRDSIASASEKLREANAVWATTNSQNNNKNRKLFGNRRLASLLIDVDFAGAIVSLQGRLMDDQQTKLAATLTGSRPSEGRYGQYVQDDAATTASLRAPGVAVKVEFEDNGVDDPNLNAEIKVDASTNVLYPTVVPLIKQVTASVKEVVGDQERSPRVSTTSKLQPQKIMQEKSLHAADPDTILGRCKLNIGLWICKQEFSLSCQPIARVAATAQFDKIYMTVNTVQSPEQRRFFAILVAFNSLQASVKHVYSNESTASFEVESMVMSLMNSKHVSNSSGISAILKVSPMKSAINAKQVQDFLLFREIWLPSSEEPASNTTFRSPSTDNQAYMVQRYQQVASAGAFPWNSTIAIDELEIQLDMGQTLGKSEFTIKNLWLSSKKTSDWEQNLCIGFDTMGIESKGRMSGFVELSGFKVRTFIKWPEEKPVAGQTPLIQASVAFGQLQAKASFEYQPFLIADIAQFEFLMYNVRNTSGPQQDRLVSVLEGEKVQVFCTTLTASQSLALYQAWQRLAQDKQAAYEASLREIERYLRRRSSVLSDRGAHSMSLRPSEAASRDDKAEKAPISLHTDVVVTIKAVNVGAFPSTFSDNQIFKLEALEAEARFAVSLEEGKIHSGLGLTLGQLRVALSSVNRPTTPVLEDLSVSEVASRATGSRGGTILKVPRVVASMETWQRPGSHQIEFIFKSAFEGKVDVGWNYSRISFIRGMWMSHSRALASRLGKPLPSGSVVRITGGPRPEEDGGGEHGEQEKITAVVNVPQSRYQYTALEPPVIETPQLRDMGEATPPLEWIGLHRDKLPNITHQIIIVTLLEVAKEVEDAYYKILGSS